MEGNELKVAKTWNDFIEALMLARESWDFLQRSLDNNFVNRERLPFQLQKYLGMYRKMQFSVAIPLLVGHWQGYGGLDNMVVGLPKEKEQVDGGWERVSEGPEGWRFRRQAA